jgi:hypothetical protein
MDRRRVAVSSLWENASVDDEIAIRVASSGAGSRMRSVKPNPAATVQTIVLAMSGQLHHVPSIAIVSAKNVL